MLQRFEKILSLYEDFRSHKGSLSGGEGFFDYIAPSSLHSDITSFAYGIRKAMPCINIQKHPAQSIVTLRREDLNRRFYLKLTASLNPWKGYTCGIALDINGAPVYENSREFFENVNLGWPTVYIPLSTLPLQEGENALTLRQTGGSSALLVSKIELLSLPGLQPGEQIGFCSAARIGNAFTLPFLTCGAAVSVAKATGCEVLEILPSGKETLIRLRAETASPSLTLSIGECSVEAVLPEIVPGSKDLCLVGTDSDDHRHDDSDETRRIIEIFTNTAMGDFWQARPQFTRNYHALAPREFWQEQIHRLLAFGVQVSQADGAKAMPWLSELCGSRFIGRHFHEAYLFFCAALERSPELTKTLCIDMPALRASESFSESKALFTNALKRMYESCQDNPGLTSVGSPSLLTVYEARTGFERVTIEPVSNIALLIGAVRGANPRQWGAHVPTDWYFGEPNDETKSRKALLAMQQLYINGADYIYAENSLFKTNAFSREDWEDPFCARNRQYHREFIAYKEKNPREGTLQKDLAVIYGNNEFFLWHHDDRIAELPENGDWDQKLWGKWEDNRHHELWRAVDAWLPLAQEQHSRKNVLNLDLFSGTPYGAVDVIPYESNYGDYKAVALLGWNTCVDGFAEKLLGYVQAGGHAFVSTCHFNRTDRCDRPFACDEEQIKLLFDAAGQRSTFIQDPEGNPLVWQLQIGKGLLYFGMFDDYTCTPQRMDAMQAVLRQMGQDTAQAVCDNPNLCVTLRSDGSRRHLHVLNVCANSTAPQPYTLRLATGETISGEAPPCQIITHTV